MKIENQVCLKELAEKLKKLGVKQDSYFYYNEKQIGTPQEKKYKFVLEVGSYSIRGVDGISYSAFSVAELVNMLIELNINDKISLGEISADFLANKLINHYERWLVK